MVEETGAGLVGCGGNIVHSERAVPTAGSAQRRAAGDRGVERCGLMFTRLRRSQLKTSLQMGICWRWYGTMLVGQWRARWVPAYLPQNVQGGVTIDVASQNFHGGIHLGCIRVLRLIHGC
jgi:hypothetical protein